MTMTVEDGIELSQVTMDEIKKVVSDLLIPEYSVESEHVDLSFDKEKITRIFIVKQSDYNKKSFVNSFVEQDGIVYEENSDNDIFSVSGLDFIDKVSSILAEV